MKRSLRDRPKFLKSLDADSALAAAYRPVGPLLGRLRLKREGSRPYNPAHVLVPQGFAVELVACGFNSPVHCCFDDDGFCYVTEGGHKIEARPRILKVDVSTGEHETFLELPEERWIKTGSVTGGCWHDGYFYFSNTNALSRVRPGGEIEDIVTDLPGLGDHQTNYPNVGPDGKLYWGQGTATNLGVVGADNYAYEWLRDFRDFHDVPGQDIVLAGRNFEYPDVFGNPADKVTSGAYVPFGTETTAGRVVKGDVRASGSILCCNPDGSDLQLVAWGLRNPYGTAFHPDGRLFAVEHGIDERSQRFIVDDNDDFYEIQRGAWYGWPDFASGIRLDDPCWGEAGQGREPVLAEHPDPDPPKPFATFPTHSAANGVDFCRDPGFGFEGDAFVALFGDLAPVTSKRVMPVGYKVVRVDMASGEVVDFAVNKLTGPASKLPHRGFERPSHCQFGPDGALYVVDWGVVKIAPEVGGIRMKPGTGALWRIRRTEGEPGDRPPKPTRVPLYGLMFGAPAAAATAIGLVLWRRRRS